MSARAASNIAELRLHGPDTKILMNVDQPDACNITCSSWNIVQAQIQSLVASNLALTEQVQQMNATIQTLATGEGLYPSTTSCSQAAADGLYSITHLGSTFTAYCGLCCCVICHSLAPSFLPPQT